MVGGLVGGLRQLFLEFYFLLRLPTHECDCYINSILQSIDQSHNEIGQIEGELNINPYHKVIYSSWDGLSVVFSSGCSWFYLESKFSFKSSFSDPVTLLISCSSALNTELLKDLRISLCSSSAFSLFLCYFMKQIKASPSTNMPAQKPNPPALCYLLSPLTIMVMKRPRIKPPKFPTAKSMPTAEPSPTGKTSSQPNQSIIGTRGMRKKELKAEIKLATAKTSVMSSGQKSATARREPKIGAELPHMQITIHFLQTPCFLCIGPITITPMMPLTTGLPPTAATARGKLLVKNGLIRKDKIIERALKMPKQHPNATKSRIQFLFFSIFGIAILNGCRSILAESEGGVGGLLF